MTRPADLRYASTHEWVRVQGDVATIGITDFAVEQLSDLAFIDLPDAGAKCKKGARFGEIESTKAVSDLLAPVTGEIIEVNTEVVENLQYISSSPYERGWLVRVRMSNPAELEGLLNAEAYETHVQAEQH